jgi:hypothetical protein
MKHFIILLIIFAFSNVTSAQTKIILNDGTSLTVPIGAEICADTIILNTGGSLILEDPSGICSRAIIQSVGPVVYDNHFVDDDNLQGSSGNGDGIINPGELIELFVDLNNSGLETALNVNANLSDDSPYTTFTSNTTDNYGDIIGGGTVTNPDDFDIQIDPSTPDGHLITFTLEITASNGGPWTDQFSISVAHTLPVGPVIYDNHLVDDDNLQGSSGNGDGIINPGELIELFVDLNNSGEGMTLNVSASISDDSPYTSFTSNTTSNYGNITGGGTATNTNDFDIQIDPSTPNGHIITFTMQITALNGGPWTETFSESVTADVPDINVIPENYNYGNTLLGSSSSKTFVIENLGTVDLIVSLTDLIGTNSNEFSIDTGEAPFAVSPGLSHNVEVSFNPTSEGSKICTLRFRSNDPDEDPKDIQIEGNGIIGDCVPLVPVAPLEVYPYNNITLNLDLGSTLIPVNDLRIISFDLLYTNTEIIDYLDTYQIGGFWGGNTPTVVVVADDPAGKVSISMFILGGSQSGHGTIISLDFLISASATEGQAVDWSFGVIAADDSNADPICIQPGTAITTIIQGLEVWSGDTDNNGEVQIIDINNVVNRFSNTGPARPNASCDWTGQICPPWSPESDTYIDANGNGQIEITDINCIVGNFGETHPVTSKPEVKTGDFTANPPLTGTCSSYMDPGEEYWAEITVGESTFPVTDMNVISFDFLFDNTQYIDYLGYEVGSFMSGATAIVIPDDPNGMISASLFNLSHSYSGYGVVMRFKFVVKPTTPPVPAILISNSWGAVAANRTDGSDQPLNPQIFTYFIVPVELVSFNANIEKNNVILSWETSSEFNNKGFEIERMIEKDWEKIAFVEGNGTTTEEKHYQYADDFKYTSVKGIVKYRLKQIDFNGTYKYSNIIVVDVDFTPNQYVLYQNYPNPFNPSTTIKYALPKSSKVNLSVYNVVGEVVSILVNEVQEGGFHEIDLDVSNLPSGIYYYRITADSFVETKKMILMK